MNYYIVPVVQTTDSDGNSVVKPSLPSGTPFSGATDGNTYLIATTTDLSGISGVTQVTDLTSTCQLRGLLLTDVQKWNIG